MIKKVSSWVFGSFFRQLGRFLFFLVLGGLVVLLVQHNNINFKWTDLLGIDTIKADTYVKGVDSPWKNSSGTALPKNGPFHYIDKLSGTGGSNTAFEVSEFYLTSNDQVDITSIKGGTVEIPFYISATVVSSTGGGSQLVCATWQPQGQGYYCSQFQMRDFTDSTTLIKPNVNVWTMLVYDNGYTDMCTIDMANNKIRCPIANLPNNNKIWFIQVRTQVYYYDNYPQQWYTIGLGDKVNLFKNDFVSLEEQQQNQTQTIIESQENQTQQQIESQQVCTDIIVNENSTIANGYFTSTGNINSSNDGYYRVTDYIKVNKSIKVLENGAGNVYSCFYTEGKQLISCIVNSSMVANNYITIPNNTYYARFTIRNSDGKPKLQLKNCENGNQAINNIISDTNTTSDVNTAHSFFSDTNSTSESALSDIVSSPLTLLNNLSSGTFNDICATLNNKQICLPSGSIIWNRQHGGAGVHDHWFRGGSTQDFITFFNLVFGGFILYKCLISLFHSVHKMLDPTQTYVEVMKL